MFVYCDFDHGYWCQMSWYFRVKKLSSLPVCIFCIQTKCRMAGIGCLSVEKKKIHQKIKNTNKTNFFAVLLFLL